MFTYNLVGLGLDPRLCCFIAGQSMDSEAIRYRLYYQRVDISI